MGLNAPSWVRKLLALIGATYPAGDEDKYHDAAGYFRDSAERVQALRPLLTFLVSMVLNGVNTAVSVPFALAMSDFYDGPDYLGVTRDGYNSLGQISDDSGDQLLEAKVYSISIAAGLLAQLIIDSVMEAFFPEFMNEVLSAQFAIFEFLLKTWFGRWLMKLLEQAAMGIAIQEEFDVVTQAVSIKVLHIQNSWNWTETGIQALVGLLGAAMGIGLMPLERMLTKELDDFLSKLFGLDKPKLSGGDDGVDLPGSGEDAPDPVPHDVPEPLPEPLPEPEPEPVPGPAGGPDEVHESEPEPLPEPEDESRPAPVPDELPAPVAGPGSEDPVRPEDVPLPEGGPDELDGRGSGDPVRPEDVPLPEGGPDELDLPELEPIVITLKEDVPAEPEKVPIGSLKWWIGIFSELPPGIVIGGVHNAGHEVLFNTWTTGSGSWNWSTFSGGSAQTLAHPIGVLTGGHIRLVTSMPISAHDLLAAGLGEITPQMLNEIQAAGNPIRQIVIPRNADGVPVPVSGGHGDRSTGSVDGEVSGGGDNESGAVSILGAARINIGQDTAFNIALHAGFVPTVGSPADHAAYPNKIMVRLPPFRSPSGMRPPGVPAPPTAPSVNPPAPPTLAATASPTLTATAPHLADLPPPAGQNQATVPTFDSRGIERPDTPPPDRSLPDESSGETEQRQDGGFVAPGELLTPPPTPPLRPTTGSSQETPSQETPSQETLSQENTAPREVQLPPPATSSSTATPQAHDTPPPPLTQRPPAVPLGANASERAPEVAGEQPSAAAGTVQTGLPGQKAVIAPLPAGQDRPVATHPRPRQVTQGKSAPLADAKENEILTARAAAAVHAAREQQAQSAEEITGARSRAAQAAGKTAEAEGKAANAADEIGRADGKAAEAAAEHEAASKMPQHDARAVGQQAAVAKAAEAAWEKEAAQAKAAQAAAEKAAAERAAAAAHAALLVAQARAAQAAAHLDGGVWGDPLLIGTRAPGGAVRTRSGLYVLAEAGQQVDTGSAEYKAAMAVPYTRGVVVLAVHAGTVAGTLRADGQDLAPDEFYRQKVAGSGLPAANVLLTLSCEAGVVRAAQGTAIVPEATAVPVTVAGRLGELHGSYGLGADSDAVMTPDAERVVSGKLGFTGDGKQTVASVGGFALTDRAAQKMADLKADVLAALRDKDLAPHLPPGVPVPEVVDAGPVMPVPGEHVRWGQAGSSAQATTARAHLLGAQYLRLAQEGLRPRADIARGGDSLFDSVIASVNRSHPGYLSGVLARYGVVKTAGQVTTQVLRDFLADRFTHDHLVKESTLMSLLTEAGVTHQQVARDLRTRGTWNGVLARLVPRMLDHLGVRLSYLNESGLFAHLTSAGVARQRGYQPLVRVVLIGGPLGSYVALERGVPARPPSVYDRPAFAPAQPLPQPDDGLPKNLADVASAAGVVGGALVRRDAIELPRPSAQSGIARPSARRDGDQARATEITQLNRDVTTLSPEDLVNHLSWLARVRVYARAMRDAEANRTAKAEAARKEVHDAAAKVPVHVFGGAAQRERVWQSMDAVADLARARELDQTANSVNADADTEAGKALANGQVIADAKTQAENAAQVKADKAKAYAAAGADLAKQRALDEAAEAKRQAQAAAVAAKQKAQEDANEIKERARNTAEAVLADHAADAVAKDAATKARDDAVRQADEDLGKAVKQADEDLQNAERQADDDQKEAERQADEDQQEAEKQADEVQAAAVKRAMQAWEQAARAQLRRVLDGWNLGHLAEWGGELAYARVILGQDGDPQTQIQIAAQSAAASVRAVAPRPGQLRPSPVLSAAQRAALSPAEQAEIGAAREAARARATHLGQNAADADKAAGSAERRQIEMVVARRSVADAQRLNRSLPVGFGAQLKRWADKHPGETLGPGQEQEHVAWGERGQIARIGRQWLGGVEGDRAIARQAAEPIQHAKLKAAVEEKVFKLLQEKGNKIASRTLAKGITVRRSGRTGGARTAEVRLVLGPLGGDDGPAYLPAFDVEQHVPIGRKPGKTIDAGHNMLGGTSYGFTDAMSTTVPFVNPASTVHGISWFTGGPSVVLGASRSYGRFEGGDADNERFIAHTRGNAYFSVPENATHAGAGSHWEITLRNDDGEVMPLGASSDARNLFAPSARTADFGAVTDGAVVQPAEALLSFPLDEATPTGEPPPVPRGELPTDQGPPRPLGATQERPPEIRLPANWNDAELEAFHEGIMRVFAMPNGFVPPKELTDQILALFRKPSKELSEGINEDFSEDHLFGKYGSLMTSGMVGKEHDLGLGGWVMTDTKARMLSIQRAGGKRNVSALQDARHLPYVGSYKTVTGNGTLYFQFLLDKIPTGEDSNLVVFPWGGLSFSDSLTDSPTVGGGDWRFVIYPNIDVVTYAVTLRYFSTVHSSVNRANDKSVQADQVVYIDVPAEEAARFESDARWAAAAVRERQASETLTGDALDQAVSQIRTEAGPRVESDGPPVTDKAAPPSIATAQSRGPGVIDLWSGAGRIIPRILEEMKEAEKASFLQVAAAFRPPRRTARDWLNTKLALERLFSAEAVIPMSSLLMAGPLQGNVIRQIQGGGEERTDIELTWRPDPGAEPLIVRKAIGGIEHYPLGYAASPLSDSLSSGVSLGAFGTAGPDLPKDHQQLLESIQFGAGYGLFWTRTEESRAGQGSSWIHGWSYGGPVLQALYRGNFELSVKTSYRPDPRRYGTLGPAAVRAVHGGGVLAANAYDATARRVRSSSEPPPPSRPLPEWAPVTDGYDSGPIPIPATMRIVFPESVAVQKPKGPPPYAGQQTQLLKVSGGNRPVGAKKTVTQAIPPVSWSGEAKDKSELTSDHIPMGILNLPSVVAVMKQMAAEAGIGEEQTGHVLSQHVNEDQVILPQGWPDETNVVTIDLARQGFAFDKQARFTVRFEFYDLTETGEMVLLSDQDLFLADAGPGHTLSSNWANIFTLQLAKLASSLSTGGSAPGSSGDGAASLIGNIWNTTNTKAFDETWAAGRWVAHPPQLFKVMGAHMLAEITLHTWEANALGRLAPDAEVRRLQFTNSLDVYEPVPRPVLLPPPGVPQALPAEHVSVVSAISRLDFEGSSVDGLNPLQQQIRRLAEQLDPGALRKKYRLSVTGAELDLADMPDNLLAITSKVALFVQAPAMAGAGFHIHEVTDEPGHTAHLHFVIRSDPDPESKGFSYDHSEDDATLHLFQVDTKKDKGEHGQKRQPRPGWRWQYDASGTTRDPDVPEVDLGPDFWTKNHVITWSVTDTKSGTKVVTKRAMVIFPGQAHYFRAKVDVEINAFKAVKASVPATAVTLGAAAHVTEAVQGPANLRRPVMTATVRMNQVSMIPDEMLPRPGERPLPSPSTRYLPPGGGDGSIDALITGHGLQPLAPADQMDALLKSHGVLTIAVPPQVLRTANDHLLAMLTGASTAQDRRGGQLPFGPQPATAAKPERNWLQRLLFFAPPGGASRAISRVLSFTGLGDEWLSSLFAPPTLTRMALNQGGSLPFLIKDTGLLSAKGAIDVEIALVNPSPYKWRWGGQATEGVKQDERKSQQTSDAKVTASESVNPLVSAAGGNVSVSTMPSGVFNWNSSKDASGAERSVRDTTFRREGHLLVTGVGLLVAFDASALNAAGPLKLPDVPVLSWFAGGKQKVAYLLEGAVADVSPEAALELRILTDDGIPLPRGLYLPLISSDRAADVERYKAAASMRLPANWFPVFANYDRASGQVKMTVTEQDPATGHLRPVPKDLTVEQVAGLVRESKDWDGAPVVVLGENTAALAKGLGPLLNTDTVGMLDKGLLHELDGEAQAWAARFGTDGRGNPDMDSMRPGNSVLYPASGTGPELLGHDLNRALEYEVPARIRGIERGVEAAHVHGTAERAEPVGWIAPAPSDPAARSVQAPVGELRAGQDAGAFADTDLGGGLTARTFGGAGGRAVLVFGRGSDPAWLAELPSPLPRLDGFVTVAVPDPHLGQDELTVAIDRLLTSPTLAGQNVLLLAAGAGGRGQDSLAHRIQLRHQQYSGPLLAGPGTTGGPVVVAPGGLWGWDEDGGLRTYHADLAAQRGDPPLWWRFEHGRDPLPQGGTLAAAVPGVTGPGAATPHVPPRPDGPFALRVQDTADGDKVVDEVVPARRWLLPGHGLVADAGRADLLRPGGLSGGRARGTVVQVTAAGLWIRRDTDPPQWAARQIQNMATANGRPVIAVGTPGEVVTRQEWELAWHLVRHLPPGLTRGGQLLVTGDLDPATITEATRLARPAGLGYTAPHNIMSPPATAATQPRVQDQPGPLPRYQLDPAIPDPQPIPEPAAPAVRSGVVMSHGIPHGDVQLGPETFALDQRVMVNIRQPQFTYITIRRGAGAPSLDDIVTGRGQLTLPGEGFFRVQFGAPARPEENTIVLRVRIPPGAAINAQATLDALQGRPPSHDDGDEIWLPRNTMARVTVTEARATETGLVTKVRLTSDLASLVAGVPRRGSPEVAIPDWAWAQDENLIDDYLLEGSGSGRIDAGWFFNPVRQPAGATIPLRGLASRIPELEEQTVLHFPVRAGRPVINGRAISPELFVRMLRRMIANNPGLDKKVMLLPAALKKEYARATVDLSLRPMVHSDTHVHLVSDDPLYLGLPLGTMIATNTRRNLDGTRTLMMPPTGHWHLRTPSQARRNLNPDTRPPDDPDTRDRERQELLEQERQERLREQQKAQQQQVKAQQLKQQEEEKDQQQLKAQQQKQQQQKQQERQKRLQAALLRLEAQQKQEQQRLQEQERLRQEEQQVQTTGPAGSAAPPQPTLRLRPQSEATAQLKSFRRQAIEFIGRHNLSQRQGESRREMEERLEAVLAQASGHGQATQAWNNRVEAGLSRFRSTTQDRAYLTSVPGYSDGAGEFTTTAATAGHARTQPGTGDIFEVTFPIAAHLSRLTGVPGDVMFRAGTRFEVASVTARDGRRVISLRHALTAGWAWLDRGRGLAVPVNRQIAGTVTALDGWRAAAPGAGRGYAIHLDTGLMVLGDRTELGLSDGWIPHDGGLLHRDGGIFINRAGAVSRTNLPRADRMRLSRDRQLNSDDLSNWLGEHGAVQDPQLAPGWVERTDGQSRLWQWNGPGIASELPPGLTKGQASGHLMRCLPDSLSQLMHHVLPEEQHADMTTDNLVRLLRLALPRGEEAYRQIMNNRTIDVFRLLPTFTHMFQVRVQVFEFRRAGEQITDETGRVLITFDQDMLMAHPVEGPEFDEQGNRTPILHLYWSGLHFEPLTTASYPVQLPLREPLGGGPAGSVVGAAIQLRSQYQGVMAEVRNLLQIYPEFRGQVEQINRAWRAFDLTITPDSKAAAAEDLENVLVELISLRDYLMNVWSQMPGEAVTMPSGSYVP